MNVCGHTTTIGSYPGECHVTCCLPVGHPDEHEASVFWDHTYPECDDAPSSESKPS